MSDRDLHIFELLVHVERMNGALKHRNRSRKLFRATRETSHIHVRTPLLCSSTHFTIRASRWHSCWCKKPKCLYHTVHFLLLKYKVKRCATPSTSPTPLLPPIFISSQRANGNIKYLDCFEGSFHSLSETCKGNERTGSVFISFACFKKSTSKIYLVGNTRGTINVGRLV